MILLYPFPSTLTLLRSSVTSSLKFVNRSIAVPYLRNKLPPILRQNYLAPLANSRLRLCSDLSLKAETIRFSHPVSFLFPLHLFPPQFHVSAGTCRVFVKPLDHVIHVLEPI